MGQRSRKRRTAPAAPQAQPHPQPPQLTKQPPADPNAQMKRGYARAEARNEAIRQELEPLAPGERPKAVTVAAIVGALLVIGNLVAAVLSDPTGAEWRFVGIQTGVLLVATVGMWLAKYWAVLGFQALLGLAVVIAFLSVLRASNVQAVVFCLAIIVGCGTLFWHLIRAMARLQLPTRPGAAS